VLFNGSQRRLCAPRQTSGQENRTRGNEGSRGASKVWQAGTLQPQKVGSRTDAFATRLVVSSLPRPEASAMSTLRRCRRARVQRRGCGCGRGGGLCPRLHAFESKHIGLQERVFELRTRHRPLRCRPCGYETSQQPSARSGSTLVGSLGCCGHSADDVKTSDAAALARYSRDTRSIRCCAEALRAAGKARVSRSACRALRERRPPGPEVSRLKIHSDSCPPVLLPGVPITVREARPVFFSGVTSDFLVDKL
jgi:hypothetical protein